MVVSSPTAQTCARHSCARRPSGAAPPSAPASATPTSEACSLTPLLARGKSRGLLKSPPGTPAPTLLHKPLSRRRDFRPHEPLARDLPRSEPGASATCAQTRSSVRASRVRGSARGRHTPIELTGLTLPRLDSRPPTARHPPQEGADFTLARGLTPSTFDMARGHFKACGVRTIVFRRALERGHRLSCLCLTDSAVSACIRKSPRIHAVLRVHCTPRGAVLVSPPLVPAPTVPLSRQPSV